MLLVSLVIFCCENEKNNQYEVGYQVTSSPGDDIFLRVSYSTPSGLDSVYIMVDENGQWAGPSFVYQTGNIVHLELIHCGGKPQCHGYIYLDGTEVAHCEGEGDRCIFLVP